MRVVAALIGLLAFAACGGGGTYVAPPQPSPETDGAVTEAADTEAEGDAAKAPKKSAEAVDPARAYVDAIAASWAGTDGIDADDARCWSEKFVDTVGLGRLAKVGAPGEFAQTVAGLDYTVLELTRAEGKKVHDHFATCGMDVGSTILDTFAAEDTFPDEARACVDKGVDDAMLRDFVITSMVEGAEQAASTPDGMVAVVFRCAYGIDMEMLLDDADG